MRGFGPEVSFGGPERVLPLSLTVGAYLLDTVDVNLPRWYQAIETSAPAERAARVGAELVESPEFVRSSGASRPDSTPGTTHYLRVGLLVIGDGSAKRSPTAPGYLDPRAEAFDNAIADALARADTECLLDIDPGLSAELWCEGRVAWQAVAGADTSRGTKWRARLRYHQAPYGVGYMVANWSSTYSSVE
jgi:hypothetical protein